MTERPTLVDDAPRGPVERLRRDYRPYGANLLPRRGVVPFCILTTGRSGSELLVHLLDSHPQIRCEGEILIEHRDFPFLFARGRMRAARHRGAEAWGFKINQLFLSERFGGAHIRGGLPRLVGRLRGHGFRFVHVRRRDTLRQALSGLRADLTGVYHLLRTDDERIGAFDVDTGELVRLLHSLRAQDAELTALVETVPHRTLWYEDHLQRPDSQQAAVDELCGWLGLRSAPVVTEFEKLAPASLRDQVKNYDEIVRALGGTPFEELLER